jgi:hypothetical protein
VALIEVPATWAWPTFFLSLFLFLHRWLVAQGRRETCGKGGRPFGGSQRVYRESEGSSSLCKRCPKTDLMKTFPGLYGGLVHSQWRIQTSQATRKILPGRLFYTKARALGSRGLLRPQDVQPNLNFSLGNKNKCLLSASCYSTKKQGKPTAFLSCLWSF